MAEPQPPAPDGERDSHAEAKRLSFFKILEFVGALAAAIGVGSIVNRVRNRSRMSDSDSEQRPEPRLSDSDSAQRPQRRVTGSRSVADTPEQRGALGARHSAGPSSDVEEERAAKADEDAALDAKIAIGHEPSDVSVGRLALVGVAIVVVSALTIGVLYGMFVFLLARPPAAEPPSALGVAQPTPPGPRLQTDPEADWQALQATEQALLHSYGWADKGAGKVRIPIDRAMDLLTQRGLPVAPGSARQFNDRTPNLDSSGGQGPTATPTPGR